MPVVGAGVYDGGIGGEVYRTFPASACYGCMASRIGLQRKTANKNLNIDYNQLDLDEIRSTSALNLDIEQIVLLQARVALNLLLAGETELLGLPPEVNFLVFANRIVPGTFSRPMHCDFYALPRLPDCLICGDVHKTADAEAEQILKALTVRAKSKQIGRASCRERVYVLV